MRLILLLLIAITLQATSIEVYQNIRALYKGVNLDKKQLTYIKHNKHKNIQILKKILNKYKNQLPTGKSVVSFILTPNKQIKNINFLIDDNEDLNVMIENIIASNKINFKKPPKNLEMRFIIKKTIPLSYTNAEKPRSPQSKNQIEVIERGTTRFEYSSKIYTRKFTTTQDGFLNITTEPSGCGQVQLLTIKNQTISLGYLIWMQRANKEIPKGEYKLLLKIKKTCDVSVEYL